MQKSVLLLLGILLSWGAVSGEEIHIKKSKIIETVTDYMPVAPGKAYEFSASLQGKSGRLDMYLFQYDAQKRKIGAYNVNAIPGTETMLTAPVSRGKTSFTVADASKWDVPKKGNIVVFDAKTDFSDLPNFRHEYYVKAVKPQEMVFWLR